MPYKIKLPVFEGPFDLLLYLIKKNEIDIYDIPIAEIIRQYLEYLELMQILDLDVAGEFIEMVATLMLIKARMLLPQYDENGEEIIEDPRSDLVAQLLEYQQFKEAGRKLGEMERWNRKFFPRAVPVEHFQKKKTPEELEWEDVSLFDLLTAFKRALESMPKVRVHQVNVIKVTMEDQVRFLFREIGNRPYALFGEIVRKLASRLELIVTFMAILDLLRLGFLSAKQSEIFGEIRLVPLQPLEFSKYLAIRDSHSLTASEKAEIASGQAESSKLNAH